jgi:hypothetical protein
MTFSSEMASHRFKAAHKTALIAVPTGVLPRMIAAKNARAA